MPYTGKWWWMAKRVCGQPIAESLAGGAAGAAEQRARVNAPAGKIAGFGRENLSVKHYQVLPETAGP